MATTPYGGVGGRPCRSSVRNSSASSGLDGAAVEPRADEHERGGREAPGVEHRGPAGVAHHRRQRQEQQRRARSAMTSAGQAEEQRVVPAGAVGEQRRSRRRRQRRDLGEQHAVAHVPDPVRRRGRRPRPAAGRARRAARTTSRRSGARPGGVRAGGRRRGGPRPLVRSPCCDRPTARGSLIRGLTPGVSGLPTRTARAPRVHMPARPEPGRARAVGRHQGMADAGRDEVAGMVLGAWDAFLDAGRDGRPRPALAAAAAGGRTRSACTWAAGTTTRRWPT